MRGSRHIRARLLNVQWNNGQGIRQPIMLANQLSSLVNVQARRVGLDSPSQHRMTLGRLSAGPTTRDPSRPVEV